VTAPTQIGVDVSSIWPSLVFVLGEERRTFVMRGAAFAVGRKAEKDLTLLNPRVSRDHATISREGDGYYLQDQESKHGTYVNGEKVTRVKLEPNDRIEFGVRGEGYLLFNPQLETSSSAREFLSFIAEKKPSQNQNVSDLEMLTLFLEAARKLNTGGVLEDILVTLVDALLRITKSERGYVFIVEPDGKFRLGAGRNDKGEALVDDSTISHSILNEAVKSGSEFLLTDSAEANQLAGRQSVVMQQLRTVICIPLRRTSIQHKTQDTQISAPQAAISAVLYLDSKQLSGKLSAVSNDILRAIAHEAATLVENAQLVQSEQAARRYQQELTIAAFIQQHLMLVDIPEVPYAKVSARSVPCTEIGGDFFDVVRTEGQLGIVVADVCGKGISAALLASIIQGMVYSQLSQHNDLAESVSAVNHFLCERNLGEKYATMFVARLKPSGDLEFVNCGHVPPLLISGQEVVELKESNLPVGLLKDATFTAGHIRLKDGDRVLVVTDGVTEAENASADFFGYDRLQQMIAGCNGLADLLHCVNQFSEGLPPHDDCTALELIYRSS